MTTGPLKVKSRQVERTHADQRQVLVFTITHLFHHERVLTMLLSAGSVVDSLIGKLREEMWIRNPVLRGHEPSSFVYNIQPDGYELTLEWVFPATTEVKLEAL